MAWQLHTGRFHRSHSKHMPHALRPSDRRLTPLAQLAAHCGVDLERPGSDGQSPQVREHALRVLLAALGVSAGTDAEIESSGALLMRRDWARELPPVMVVREHASAALVTLPAGTGRLAYELTLEDGTRRAGTVLADDLAVTARAELDGTAFERRRLPLSDLPCGYHQITLESGATSVLIVTPGSCWLPAGVPKERLWGLSTQLYLVRSAHNWGIGDFTDLRDAARLTADRGGDVLGINPLHMLFPDNPEHASPYSPASRLLLNVLNIDVNGLPEFARSAAARNEADSPAFESALAGCRESPNVDYTAVAALKTRIFRQLFSEFGSAPAAEHRALERFRHERGTEFDKHCLYLAIRGHLIAEGIDAWNWRSWPEPLRDCRSAAVREFAAEHSQKITEVAWLQWLADRQLAHAADAAADMRIGLYRDVAVGADRAGAETWSEPELTVAGANIGAPPDPFNAAGQDWGLPPINPLRLREQAYRNFIDLLRANMRHAGALRIDHVMALERLFFVPDGAAPSDGAYVHYPREDLLGILALESHRARCMIVGEDLGTVPSGFRARMAEANILSYRVLMFERDERAFKRPQEYPPLSLAVAGNHDLPTLAGWWEGTDIAILEDHGELDEQQYATRLEERERDKSQLLEALYAEGLLAPGERPDITALLSSIHRLLGRTHATLAIAQLEDIALERRPVNIPSSQRYPNWRRKLPPTLEELRESPQLQAVVDALRAERVPPART